MTVIVTGAAGFIGYHVCTALLAQGRPVLGIDNLNDYYDPALKDARLARLSGQKGFSFRRENVQDREAMFGIAEAFPKTGVIVHLAAQAGVRHSLVNPYAYVESNVMGHLVVMEMARRLPSLSHLVYASSSSVYGGNAELPFSVTDRVDLPASLYAATKRSGELMSQCYGHLHGLPMTGLRFFTVYGPWGRPDMAPGIFAKAVFEGSKIRVFNHGDMRRDFTYVDDVVAGVLAALDRPPEGGSGKVPHRLYNLGNHRSEDLSRFIALIEKACGWEAKKVFEAMQPGDVVETYADIESSRRDLGFEPRVSIDEGVPRFIAWFREYYQI